MTPSKKKEKERERKMRNLSYFLMGEEENWEGSDPLRWMSNNSKCIHNLIKNLYFFSLCPHTYTKTHTFVLLI